MTYIIFNIYRKTWNRSMPIWLACNSIRDSIPLFDALTLHIFYITRHTLYYSSHLLINDKYMIIIATTSQEKWMEDGKYLSASPLLPILWFLSLFPSLLRILFIKLTAWRRKSTKHTSQEKQNIKTWINLLSLQCKSGILVGTEPLIILLLVGLLNANYPEGSALVVLQANILSGYNNSRDKLKNFIRCPWCTVRPSSGSLNSPTV